MATEILRPNAAGDYTGIPYRYPDTGEANWQDVDEASPDDDATYVAVWSPDEKADVYNLSASSIPSGSTINSVRVYFRFRTGDTDKHTYCKPILRLGTNETVGTEIDRVSNTYETYSEILARPGGGSWSTDDLPNLQAGINLRATGSQTLKSRCTQVYVEVDYTPAAAGGKKPTRRLDPKPRTRARFYPSLKLG